jgi:glycosyltransferase involved in cell wall biosynthesis
MDIFSVIIAWLGILILIWRTYPGQFREHTTQQDSCGISAGDKLLPKVSIIIPARNEELNLPPLLASLEKLGYPHYEVIVVDDQSRDRTREIAESYGAIVIKGAPLPAGWNGKNWACHQALEYAAGEIFLFTDADTEHLPDSLKRAVMFFRQSQADMMSALPYYLVEKFWEKLMGPFITILLAATSPYSPQPKRLFAIGQYLMFTKESYKKQGGHAAVKNEYPDDLALANACLHNKGKFLILRGKPLYQVKLYNTVWEFITGWRRNFLAGIQQSSVFATLEVILIFFGLTGGGKLFTHWMHFIPAAVGACFIAIRQKSWGKFSTLGVLLMPFALMLFCTVTALAAFDYARGNVLHWKDRSYKDWGTY